MLKIFTTILVVTLLGACATPARNISVAHAAITIQSDRRSLGTIIDDNTLYLDLYKAINQGGEALKDAHLNFLTYDTKVLVTGEVAKQEHQTLIDTLITDNLPQVLKIINETKVAKASSFLSRANDGLINTQIELLFYNQDVFHPAHIRVTTEDNTVYLMGRVTKREGEAAARVAKKVNGVRKIVKVFEYIKSRPIAEIKAEKKREIEAQRQTEIAEQKQALEKQKLLIKAEERKIQDQINKLDGLEEGTSF